MATKVIPAHKKARQNYFWYYRRTTWLQDLVFGSVMTVVGYALYQHNNKVIGIVLMMSGPIIFLLAVVRYGMGWKEKGQYWEDKRSGKV